MLETILIFVMGTIINIIFFLTTDVRIEIKVLIAAVIFVMTVITCVLVYKLQKKKSSKTIIDFTADKSIYVSENPPDGTKCIVGKPFVKTWTIRNVGGVIWRGRYLKCDPLPVHVSVNNDRVKIPKTLPGQEFTLKVTYTLDCEGIYHSNWKMYDENNNMTFPKIEGLGVTLIAEK